MTDDHGLLVLLARIIAGNLRTAAAVRVCEPGRDMKVDGYGMSERIMKMVNDKPLEIMEAGETAQEAPTYPPLNFPGELTMAKAILERHGWFVVGPLQKVSSPPPGYDPRVWRLLELTRELNRRLAEMVQR